MHKTIDNYPSKYFICLNSVVDQCSESMGSALGKNGYMTGTKKSLLGKNEILRLNI